jgi:hypothetical protein
MGFSKISLMPFFYPQIEALYQARHLLPFLGHISGHVRKN